jgi:hypothetical protein
MTGQLGTLEVQKAEECGPWLVSWNCAGANGEAMNKTSREFGLPISTERALYGQIKESARKP